MPLDKFQKGIIEVVRANRDVKSPFAGGSVIQQHGIRFSDDQDVFTSGNLDTIMRRDTQALTAAGYTVVPGDSFTGFRECIVAKPMIGRTVLQWTLGLVDEFYAPVPDPLFGFRLHFADLAVNKALAAGSRMEKRDFVDLWMLDRHVMPLWRMACAVPGKQPALNPFSLIENISRNWNFAAGKGAPADGLLLTRDLSLEEVGSGLTDSIHEARIVLRGVASECFGRLEVDAQRQPVLTRAVTTGGHWATPQPGGGMPSFEGVDSEMIAGLIEEYGPEGSR
ncbi:MAG: hypothetical protein OXF56_15850 [Rhodobacteraceae bacterium]|nr:hypothetical protein [Paracoccaceae bacterium]